MAVSTTHSTCTKDPATTSKNTECVRVVIRCRPMSEQELADGRTQTVEMDSAYHLVTVYKPTAAGQSENREIAKEFTFDAVYPPASSQSQIYEEAAYPIVENVLEGYNGRDQLKSSSSSDRWKTHTMVGPTGGKKTDQHGMIPRAFEHLFKSIDESGGQEISYLVRASFLEIYNEEIRDLLSKNPKEKLELKDNPDTGVYVKDLQAFVVKGVDEMRQVMAAGQRNRSVGATLMNVESSRSHSIFTITVETAEMRADGQGHIRVGKLNMVDLAGSERQSKTGSTGDTLKEATKINLSLSALGNVISALVDSRSTFVPYRDSKLTRLLQDSLGGNTKTVMVANIGPADYNYDETLYAHRAKSIKNKPRINEDPKDAMIREFQEEISRLKSQLAVQSGMMAEGGGSIPREVTVEKVVEKVVHVQGPSEKEIEQIKHNMAKEQQEVHQKFEEERQKILAEKTRTEQERQSLLSELQRKEEQGEKQRQQQVQLLDKLKQMEDKMLMGTKVIQQAAVQEKELKKARRALEKKKEDEERIRAKVKEHEEERLLLAEKYEAKDGQVLKLTNKLEKLWHKYKNASAEVDDLQREFQQEREDMLESIRALSKELKLKSLAIDYFIPPDEYQRIVDRAQYDQVDDSWEISHMEIAGNAQSKRPGSALGFKRPTAEFTRVARQHSADPRFRSEGILQTDLLPTERLTQAGEVDPSQPMNNEVLSAIRSGLDENDYVPNASVYFSYAEVTGERPRSANRSAPRPQSGTRRPGWHGKSPWEDRGS
ncbi:hypothetical protein FOZ62_024023 [Perkinsus olseni]|uniref:Kinesin-like protein n=1 Tax=Perkinsus olseni TaxID=32597 RepID=A0A7J6QD66_PEROL|nr:hypothetical protein FOZ62_024023 [Perkinsus olseni]